MSTSFSVSRRHGEEIQVLFRSSGRKGTIPPLHHFKPHGGVIYNHQNSILAFVIAAISRGRGVFVSAAEEPAGGRGTSSCAGSKTEPHSSCLCWTV